MEKQRRRQHEVGVREHARTCGGDTLGDRVAALREHIERVRHMRETQEEEYRQRARRFREMMMSLRKELR